MGNYLRKIFVSLVLLSLLQPSLSHAGILKKITVVGAAVAAVDIGAPITATTVEAIGAVGMAAYASRLADLRSDVAAHRIIGPAAVKIGIAAWLRLQPRRLAPALAVKADTLGGGDGQASSQSATVVNSATGDPNDEEPEQGGRVVVKRSLRADDFGLRPENLSELRVAESVICSVSTSPPAHWRL